MALSITEKLKLSSRSNELYLQSKNAELSIMDRLALTNERNGIIKKLGESVKAVELDNQPEAEQSELIKRYLALEFSKLPVHDFVDVIRNVHAEDLDIDGIRKGMIGWLNANGFAA